MDSAYSFLLTISSILFPDCEVERIKREIPLLENRDEKTYMAFLVYTGMRPEEIRGIRWEDTALRVSQAMEHSQNRQSKRAP